MAGGIWSAIGAALSQGGRTFGDLTEQENFARRQKELFDFQKSQAERSAFESDRAFGMQREQFDVNNRQRELENLRAAITGAPLGARFGEDTITKAKEHGLDPFLNITPGRPELNVENDLSAFIGGQAQGPATTQLPASATRHATLAEQGTQAQLAAQQRSQEQDEGYRAWVQANPNASAQERFAAAQQFGQRFEGLSPDEDLSRQRTLASEAHTRRMSELDRMYPPDRFGGGGRNNPATQWYTGFHKNVDSVRQTYSAELSAISRLMTEATTPAEIQQAQAASEQIRKQIEQTAMERTVQLYGPPPREEGPPQASAPMPEGNPAEAILRDYAEEIAANPVAFLNELRNDPLLPPEVKREVEQGVLAIQRQRQASQGPPDLAQSARDAVSGIPNLSAPTQPATGAGMNPAANVDIMGLVRSLFSKQ